ncbi:restriction endonuclease subunit S [Elizabethkingia anophelis]|uniref:restriction endonuclease subunit S n=2 Tax=Elizabethkingia anophelis TaxID=1117645 RepID=UPI0020B6E7FE|nr:restriction endonuclease subunit S [Elizabethkingia anophelis]UTG60550.1 restriction endonuclease subunit S [Elizabethkingia anophelis]
MTFFPNLRFPGFEGDWKTVKLGDITSWSSGGTPSKENPSFWNGEIPWISASSMRGLVYSDSELKITEAGLLKGSKLAKKGSLLILVRGSMLFNKIPIGIVSKNVAFNQDVKSIVVNEQSSSEYILYWFLAFEPTILNIVSGTGIGAGKLDLKDLKDLDVNIPNLIEQKKISAFLSLIESRIETQRKIIEKLETLMKESREKIFLRKIKFKDDNFSKWEEKKLGDILIESNEKSIKNNQYRVISSTAKGLFYQDDYFTRDIASQDNTGYKILKKEQLVFSPQNLWLGNINVNIDFEIGLVSPSYKIFNFNTSLTSYSYCNFFLKTSLMLFEYAQSSIQGASVVRRNLDLNMFFNIRILLPSIKEQAKITSFLSSIQKKIDIEKQILEKLELQKKFLLANLFV